MKEVSRAIIKNGENKVLLGRRADGAGKGMYTLIGGKIDDGENPKEAAIREVKEEIGLDFQADAYLEKIDETTDPENLWMVYYFLGSVSGELVLDLMEVDEIIYVSEPELDNWDILAEHKDILRNYFSSITNDPETR